MDLGNTKKLLEKIDLMQAQVELYAAMDTAEGLDMAAGITCSIEGALEALDEGDEKEIIHYLEELDTYNILSYE